MATQKRKALTAKSLLGYSNILSGLSRAVQQTFHVRLSTPKPIPVDNGVILIYNGGKDQFGLADLEKFKRALINLDGYQVEEIEVVNSKLKFAQSSRQGVFCSIFLVLEELENGEMLTLEISYCSTSKVLTISGY